MKNHYFEFQIHNERHFQGMKDFFYELKVEKEQGTIDCSDAKWMDFFEEEVLQRFWWPTEEELHHFSEIWMNTPVEKRFTESQLQHPWDFESMIDAFANGEYELIFCEKISFNKGRIEFYPYAWPYGGNDVFRALIEYSSCEIIAESV
ncbi:hypothetical protein J6TS2_26330 [Heyndrickxia sporothermodurans]|nr:hypothetical protein J6TS2_26330 [Heyndrickxia sporothermodurans]